MSTAVSDEVQVTVGNRWLQRTYDLADNRLAGSTVRNRLAQAVVGCGNEEFRFEIEDRIITAANCRLVSNEAPTPGAGEDGEELVLTFVADDPSIEIEMRVWAPSGLPWLRKQLGIVNRGNRPITLYTASEEWLTLTGESMTYAVEESELEQPKNSSGFHEAAGQPIFTDSLFWGLEFPHSLSGRAPGGELRLLHYPGQQIQPGARWESKTAVVGAAEAGRVHDAFDRYCLSLRPFADPYRFVNWLCCWLAISPTYAEGERLLEFLKKRLVDECGARLDAFDLSAMCWTIGMTEGYEAEGLWEPKEPLVHERMSADCRAAGIPYGIYANVNGFLPFDDTYEWGTAQGFGFAADSSYCLAEPTYRAAYTERIFDFARRYQLGEITFDMMWQGNGFGCRVEGHGHLVDGLRDPHGRFGTEAVIEAHLDLLTKLREINPVIIVSMMTYDWWGSPWWLSYTDVIHAVDGDTPASLATLSPRFRDHLISARDEQLHDMYVARKRTLPMWGNDSFMGFQIRREFLSHRYPLNADDPTEQWEDELIMGTAGHLHAALLNCADHRILDETPSGVGFYADVLKWTDANRRTLFDTRLILGDPVAGEPIGYAHRGELETLLCVRSNTMTAKAVDLEITPDVLPFGGGANLVATQIYPVRRELMDGLSAGDSLHLAITGQQAHVVRLHAAGEATEPRIGGVRHRLRPAEGGEIEVDVWGEAGSTAEVELVLPWLSQSDTRSITFAGAHPKPVSASIAGPHRAEEGYHVAISVDVEEGISAQLQIYLDNGVPAKNTVPLDGDDLGDFRNPSREQWLSRLRESRGNWILEFGNTDHLPKVQVRHEGTDATISELNDDGNLSAGSIHWRPRTDPELPHSWYLIDLMPGANRIAVTVKTAVGHPRIGVWVESSTKLAHHSVRFPVPEGFVLPPQLPLLRPDEDRQVAEILPLSAVPID